jgi:hypothetical protein
MSEDLFILDTPLPLSQDFNRLKQEGFIYIQEHMGADWTNLNPADPGVTILDQVCYALTELGYCNDFDLPDILTGADGVLKLDDQFYRPQQLFTTSPVTPDDYRRFLIDGVTGVENALVIPEKFEHLPGFRVYSVYLLTGSTYDKEAVANICKAAFFLLNKARNLGELFLHPRALVVKEYYLSGTIGIKNDTLQYTLLRQMQDRINNYIFPRVAPVGYDTVQATDTSVNEILNGPLLTNGYILAGTPGSKKNLLNVIDLPALLLAIPGMVSARGLSFFASYGDNPSSPPEPVTNISEISCLPGEMLVINLYASRTGMPHTNEQLKITVAGNEIPFNPQNVLPPVPSGTPGIPVSFVYGKSAGALDRLPSGIYRDINSYYSVQNTFPAIYGAGPQGTDAGASAFEKARVKQLKGYLTLIDQVLANQFSQLANVPVLFSFKNAAVGAPSDLRTLLETKDQFQKETLPYPVPYRVFSPTYFYQSLYEVPYIRPLLKNNDAIIFITVPARKMKRNIKAGWLTGKILTTATCGG